VIKTKQDGSGGLDRLLLGVRHEKVIRDGAIHCSVGAIEIFRQETGVERIALPIAACSLAQLRDIGWRSQFPSPRIPPDVTTRSPEVA
jgi:hypothetical protein